MTTTQKTEMTATQLMELAELALRITGTPAFASADYEGEIDSLQFIDADEAEESTWAFVPIPLDEDGKPHIGCGCGHDHDEARDRGNKERDRGDVATKAGAATGSRDQGVGRAMPAAPPLLSGEGRGEGSPLPRRERGNGEGAATRDDVIPGDSGGSRRGDQSHHDEHTGSSPRAKGGSRGVASPDDDSDDSESLDDQILCVDTALAADLIKSHLREWLAERGWQVQLEMFKGQHRWRLADCLSFTDGGGDRLDTDYPSGDDELKILCESVIAVAPPRE